MFVVVGSISLCCCDANECFGLDDARIAMLYSLEVGIGVVSVVMKLGMTFDLRSVVFGLYCL